MKGDPHKSMGRTLFEGSQCSAVQIVWYGYVHTATPSACKEERRRKHESEVNQLNYRSGADSVGGGG
jgi:hypothetical protein